MLSRQLLKADGSLLVLALVAVTLLVQVAASRRATHWDGRVVAAAASLLEHGVLADSYVPGSAEAPAAGRAIPPGYPAIIAGLAHLDPRLAAGLRCLGMERGDCFANNPLRALQALQALAGILALCLAWFLAREMSGSSEIAGLATVLTYVMTGLGDLTRPMQPVLIVAAMTLACLALLVSAHRQRSVWAAAAGGVMLGCLALVEVYYAPLVALLPVLLIVAERQRARRDWRYAYRAAAAALAGASLVLAPWMVRNQLLFGDVVLATITPAEHLAERVAYNTASARELLTGALFWLPGVGDLAGPLLPAAVRRKFELYYEGSLLWEGRQIFEAAGPASSSLGQISRLWTGHVLSNPLGYLAASPLLLLRGLASTGGWLALWGILALPLLLRRLHARHSLGPFVLVAGPLIGLTVVQALLTANVPWMNLSLAFVYAYAIAEVTGGIEMPIALRQLWAGRDGATVAPGTGAQDSAADRLPARAQAGRLAGEAVLTPRL